MVGGIEPSIIATLSGRGGWIQAGVGEFTCEEEKERRKRERLLT
jgi:hypothetical protein